LRLRSGAPAAVTLRRALLGEGHRIQEAQLVGAVAHDQTGGVLRQPHTLRPDRRLLLRLEGGAVVDEGDMGFAHVSSMRSFFQTVMPSPKCGAGTVALLQHLAGGELDLRIDDCPTWPVPS